MVRSVEQIERDLTALEQAVLAIAQEFHASYRHYLTHLGQSASKQLVLAAYHICTQGFPDRFLQRSLKQRQDLQQALRQLAQQAQTQLPALLESPISHPPINSDRENQVRSTATAAPSAQVIVVERPSSSAGDGDEANAELNAELLELLKLATQQAPPPPASAMIFDPSNLPSNPMELAIWLEQLEKQVMELLQTISHAANRLLQQADILPNKLPEPVLEVAAKATGDTVGPPNLLNILVETDGESGENAKVTHIMAIRLRLAELEFNDASLTSMRSKLRQLASRLNQIGKEYQKKQRDKAIAQAEQAWRASWYED